MFTGTPEGVGKVKIGDFLEGFIDKKKIFEIKIKWSRPFLIYWIPKN